MLRLLCASVSAVEFFILSGLIFIEFYTGSPICARYA